ncbi:hypothetical protein PLICBS_006302 [Purpureocillium lilacinum]|uniref:uncharacterized protein n=1 Tax=Purpureocillium lilacinum TaxID=33203 RepID=UPI00207DD41A|nr:hypothetical protein PLICBS_006302 [Purpureocillium lilacinum]
MCKSAERGALEGSGGAETSQDFSGALPPTDSDWDLSTTAASGGEPSQRLGGGQDCPVSVLNWNIVEDWRAVLPLSRWTTVTADETLLNHLFALFWTWDHSLARILHRELLLDGLTADTQGPGRPDTRFCSEFLINSILAVSTSCFHKSDDFRAAAPRGSSFADEAFRLLAVHQEQVEVSLMQGVAILSVHEMTFGDLPLGTSLFFDKLSALRASSKIFDGPDWMDSMEVAQGDPKESKVGEALASIANGFHCLDLKLSLIANRPSTALGLAGIPPSQEEGGSPLWIPYPVSAGPQLSYHSNANVAEYELSQLAGEFLPAIEESRSSLVPDYRRSKALYDRFLAWKSSSQDFMLRGHYTAQAPCWASLLYVHELRGILGIDKLTERQGLV